MSYSLHPGAEQDLAGALGFYQEHAGRVVAARLLDEFERVAQLLLTHPGLGTPTTQGRSAFPLQVFPYCIVYRPLDDGILILIVRHQHRKPSLTTGRR